ncbi:hypothetical protein COCC4DRAFT_30014 [Bipolaris maydis ATCC 48331]|uniref:Uncharacterized protein n=2 Tax=Cochliobolus heterostrophus TaxID=5016 RepID=M2UAF1_COCH5|nr:uncharacterized protein COCC4DRAFT_30014 [Bipolaris maydis ATCC 48331]EMD90701.1 hypothetical protein COCHEDRAFT_1022493 [Bipolaris maydis C5]ENI09088.1 hypothetical protein COCC4DRAFT_30014 [Bipolaris maydis ATCC 48331]
MVRPNALSPPRLLQAQHSHVHTPRPNHSTAFSRFTIHTIWPSYSLSRPPNTTLEPCAC